VAFDADAQQTAPVMLEGVTAPALTLQRALARDLRKQSTTCEPRAAPVVGETSSRNRAWR